MTIAIGAGVIVNIIQGNIADVRRAAPTYKTDLDQWVLRIYDLLGIEDLPTLSQFIASVDIGPMVASFAGALTGILGDLALIVVYVGFLLYEQKTFPNKLARMFPEAEKRRA